MIKKNKRTFLSNNIFFCIVLLSLFFSSASAFSAKWESVPLTTQQQAKLGVSGGEGFQKVMCIVYSLSNPDIVYFGTDTAQVWKSIDGGKTWSHKGNGFSANGARSLFVSPKNPNLVIAAGFLGRERERVGNDLDPLQGIFRSDDGAKSWKFIYAVDFYKQASTGSLFVSDSRTLNKSSIRIYVGTYDKGLLVSDNNGLNWKFAGFHSGHIINMVELPAEPGTLIIATNTGLYRYRDERVKRIGGGLSGAPVSIAVTPDSPKVVYVVSSNGHVYYSSDMGQTFVDVSSGFSTMGAHFSDISISPVNSKIIYLGTHESRRKGPFYSADGGKTWKKSISINAKKLIDSRGFYFSSPFSPHPTKPLEALSASNGESHILKTLDGGKTWFYSGSGYTGARIRDITFLDNGEMILALTDHGLWKSSDAATVFYPLSVSSSLGKSSSVIAVSRQTLVASIGNWKDKMLAISKDGGINWTINERVKGALNYIFYHPQNNKVTYVGSYRSDDGLRTWRHLRKEVVAVSPVNSDIIYGLNKKHSSLYRSDDRGETWHILPNMPDSIRIYDVAIDYANNNKIYIASSDGVYIFNGKIWMRRGYKNGLFKDSHGFNYIKTIVIDPNNPNILYAGKWAPGKGVSNGIFKSVDQGMTWKPINYNLGNDLNVWDISIDPFSGTIYVGTTYGLQKLLSDNIKNDK